jgi:PKD repeat protein
MTADSCRPTVLNYTLYTSLLTLLTVSNLAMKRTVLKTIMILVLSLVQTHSNPVSGTKTVSVTGFDNHSNKSIVRLVKIPVTSVQNRIGRNTDLEKHIGSKQGPSFKR